MGVYVKGMEMPTNCAQCACCDDDARFCHAAHKYIPMVGKPKFCPLVEVKEPQDGMSDLISRQAVMDALGEEPPVWYDGEDEIAERDQWRRDVAAIEALPSAQPETHEIRTETHGVCSDTISRQDTIDAIEHVTWYHQNRNGQMVSGANSDEHQAWYKAEDVYEAIEALPSANRSGHWIDDGDCSICSKCHETYGLTLLGQLYAPNFCPNCGCDMREEEFEEPNYYDPALWE